MHDDVSVRSLTSVRPGEPVEIRRILFDSIRDHCASAGIAEGTRVVGRGRGDSTVALENAAGLVVLLPRDVARFVNVGAFA